MKLRIIQKRKYYYIFSSTLVVISILSLIFWGLKPGLDFTGGSILEVRFTGERLDNQSIRDSLNDLNLGDVLVQPAGEKNVMLRFKEINEETHQNILKNLDQAILDRDQSANNKIIEERFESIGPIIGQELRRRAQTALILAAVMIIIYIAYSFRKVSKPVASWKYGVTAIIALIHDLTITVGLFSILGHFFGIEVDSMFVSALLTILGFSVHDTIVVFDRTRENLAKHYFGDFENIFNDSINQTITRSINTSLTTLLVLTTLYFFGGKSIANFSLALIAGIIVGTYSSIFVASPLLVTWHHWERRLKK